MTDVNVDGLVSKFADDTKIGELVHNQVYKWDIDHL